MPTFQEQVEPEALFPKQEPCLELSCVRGYVPIAAYVHTCGFVALHTHTVLNDTHTHTRPLRKPEPRLQGPTELNDRIIFHQA